MDKKEAKELTNNVLLAELLIKIKSIEELLISKGILTKEELDARAQSATEALMLSVLQKANVPGDTQKLIKDLQKS